jgi:hypothetical protein
MPWCAVCTNDELEWMRNERESPYRKQPKLTRRQATCDQCCAWWPMSGAPPNTF